MGSQQDGIAYCNEGLDGRTEYRFYLDRGVFAIWYYVGADRKRKTTGIACVEDITPAFRADLRARAAELVSEARAGRVLVALPAELVQVTSTAEELRDAWVQEQVTSYPDSWKTRKIQLTNVIDVVAALPDEGTTLQRLVAERGPQRFLDVRMRQVTKGTVKHEVGVLFHFLQWLLDRRDIIAMPPRPKYRKKDLGHRVGTQRDEPVHLEDDVALAIIERLPEYASRGGRKDVPAKLPEKAFPCRDRMRFHFETGLRPSTIERLRMGVHWHRGSRTLRITPDIDKGRNEGQARKVRVVPLTQVALDILERHAPTTGLIWGRHDIRVQWKRAAIAVLGEAEGIRCAPYDLRHGAMYRMRTLGGSAPGTMHLGGHALATTADRYIRGTERAAADVVARLDARNVELAGRE